MECALEPRDSGEALARNLRTERSKLVHSERSMVPEFEWDAQKAAENLKNHWVAFDEALTVFADPLANIFDNPDHSGDERRELIIGHSAEQRLLVVSFTDRGRRTRIISARQATARERRDYEQNSPKTSA